MKRTGEQQGGRGWWRDGVEETRRPREVALYLGGSRSRQKGSVKEQQLGGSSAERLKGAETQRGRKSREQQRQSPDLGKCNNHLYAIQSYLSSALMP